MTKAEQWVYTVVLVLAWVVCAWLLLTKAVWPAMTWIFSIEPDWLSHFLNDETSFGLLALVVVSLATIMAPGAWPFGPLIAKVWGEKFWD